MRFKTFMGRLVSAVTASAMLFTGFAILPEDDDAILDTNAASAVTIDTSKKYQYIRGFGGIDHPEWTGSSLSDSQLKTAFGNGSNELGLTVLRVFVNPDKNQWNKAVKSAKYVSDLGYTVFASPWAPPSSIASSGGTGGFNGTYHLEEKNYGAYAQHLNDFGNYMKNQNVDLYAISVQNEPDYAAEWTAWTPEQTMNFVANYGDKITSTRLMSPESFQYTNLNSSWSKGGKNYYDKILNNAKAFANCDVFGTHFYGTQREWMDYPALESCGKEIWMTEVYVPNSEADSANRWPEALLTGVNIHNAMVVGNMSAYTWWYIRRSYSLMTEQGVPTKRGWNMAQFSKWVRPGSYRIDCTENPQGNIKGGDTNTGTYVSSYITPNKEIVVVAVNNVDTEFNQVFQLKNGEKITNVERYRTTSTENVANTPNMNHDTSSFNAQLPARSISTFVITLDDSTPVVIPTEPSDDPDENGYFFHDEFEADTCSWDGRGAASVLTSGRTAYAGGESLLVQDRTAGWNGAIKTLNSRVFKAGEEYSFSADVTYFDGPATRDFKLTLEYTNADGDTTWDEIASGTTAAGQWLQLANTNYKLPANGSGFKIIVETTDETLDNFYVDEAIGALPGTKIAGPPAPTLPDPTEAPFVPSVDNLVAGDVTLDGKVDVFDLVAMRQGILKNFASDNASFCADVNADGETTVADLVLLQEFLLGKKVTLKLPEIPVTKMRTISEYTPIVAANVSEFETDDSKKEKAGVKYGTIENKSYYSNFCGRNKPYNVLLPANYDKNKKYPVLYVMHGYWENQNRMLTEGNSYMPTREMIGNLIAEGNAKEMIVVFPYIFSSKTKDDCDGMNDANNEAYDNFDTVLVNELMPLIEKDYSVATGRENTAITGFSMGGRESLMIGMKHPDLFGYVGAICAAPGATGAWKFASEEAAPSLIFITAGSNDTTVYDNPKTYNGNFNSNGVPTVWHYVNGGYHGDNCIRAHLYNFVQAIFKA